MGWQDAAVGVVAIPGELIEDVFCVGTEIPRVGLVTYAQVGHRVGINIPLGIRLPAAAPLVLVGEFEGAGNRFSFIGKGVG